MSWVNTQPLLLQGHVRQAIANGENAMDYSLFSDNVFPYHLCVTHKHEPPLGGELDDRLHLENVATNSCRTSIKWTYGDVIILYHVMDVKYNENSYSLFLF
jgi:hypothetical protein